MQQLDASSDSLLPLWGLFVDFLDQGLPVVATDAKPDTWIEDGAGADLPDLNTTLRCLYVAENIGHYLRLVLRRLDPAADWAVVPEDPRYPTVDDRHVAILVRGSYIIPQGFVPLIMYRLLDGQESDRSPSALRDILGAWLPDQLHTVHQEPGPPVLVDLTAPEAPAPRWTPPARLLVPQQTSPAPPPPSAPSARADDGLPVGDFSLLAGPDDGLENPALLLPLDPVLVATALSDMGFIDERGRSVTAGQLARHDQELVRVGDPRLHLTTTSSSRTLRLLDVETASDPTTDEARRLMAKFADLAHRLNARLLTDADNLPGDA